MSFLVHHPLELGGFLLLALGLGFMLPSAWRATDQRKSSVQSMLGSAIFNLGLVALATPSVGSIDAWSATEKAISAGLLLLLVSAGVQLGIAIERWREQKPAAGNPQGVGPVGQS